MLTKPNALRPFRATIVDLFAVIGVMAAMLVANDDWIFTRKGWLDPWIYFGFFRHYDVASYLASRKEVARLPWILLGFIVNKSANPIVAAFVLHAGCFALGVVGLYAVTSRLFGRVPAVIASLAYVTYVPTHGSAGWDYHNTLLPVIFFSAYLLLTTAAGTVQRPTWNFFKFGILYALMAHTNILALLLTPAFVMRGAHQIRNWIGPETNIRKWLRDAIVGTILGAACITIALGLVNITFGRAFFFFGMLVSRSFFLLHRLDVEKVWWEPWSSGWWLTEEQTPMFEAILALIVALVFLRWKHWSLRGMIASSAACALLEFVLSFGFFAAAQVGGHPLLTPFYMLMPAALPMFVALAASIWYVSEPRRLSEGLETATIVFVACAFGIQFIGRLALNVESIGWRPQPWYNWPPIVIMLFGFAVATIIPRIIPPLFSRLRPVGTALALGCLGVAIGQANTIWPFDSSLWMAYDFRTRCPDHKALLSAIADFDKDMFPVIRSGKHVLPWYDDRESVGPTPECQLPSWTVGGPLFVMDYGANTLGPWDVRPHPEMPDSVMNSLSPGADQIAMITNNRDYVARLLQRLRRRDPNWREVQVYRVGGYRMFLAVHLIAAEPQSYSRYELQFRAKSQHGSTITALPSGAFNVSLPKMPWAYSVILSPQARIPRGEGTVVVRIRVVAGTTAVGILNQNGTSFIARDVVHASSESTDIALHVADWRHAGPLLVETTDDPTPAIAIVSSLAFVPDSVRSGSSSR